MYRITLDIHLAFALQSTAAADRLAAFEVEPRPFTREADEAMNTVLWIVQIIMAGVFIFTGCSKVLAYDKVVKALEARYKGHKIGMSRGLAAQVGLLEILGAVGVAMPFDAWPPHIFLLMAASGLALLMVVAGIYHIRRKETATPSVVLFLMAVFVIVGRWPR
jgi:hypothetical protein